MNVYALSKKGSPLCSKHDMGLTCIGFFFRTADEAGPHLKAASSRLKGVGVMELTVVQMLTALLNYPLLWDSNKEIPDHLVFLWRGTPLPLTEKALAALEGIKPKFGQWFRDRLAEGMELPWIGASLICENLGMSTDEFEATIRAAEKVIADQFPTTEQ